MSTQPMIFPFDTDGKIYVLQDDKGNTIGTGSREVCEMLLHMIRKARTSKRQSHSPETGADVRSAVDF